MAKTIAVKRRQNEDIADNTYVPPKPVYKKKLADESKSSSLIISSFVDCTQKCFNKLNSD